MEHVPTTFLASPIFLTSFEPGPLVLSWLLIGSSGKGTHDEALVEKPPPVVIPEDP